MNRIFDFMLKRIMRHGRLDVTWADGGTTSYGDKPGRHSALRFHTKAAERGILFNPELRLGEYYMAGEVSFPIEGGPLPFLCMVEDNWDELRSFGWLKLIGKLRVATRLWRQDNDARKAIKNAAHHYNIDEHLYRLFLDDDLQYTCAYFDDPSAGIDAAQQAKKRHVISKLALKPGMSVLDIGCGWGGLGLSLARLGAGDVTGVTLAEEQQRVANARAREEKLDGRVRFELKDYRDVAGPFDRIVSVGMFEAVGVAHFEEFFDHIKRMLKPDGVMMLHSIGRFGPPGATNPWIEKYIFPGGYVPSLSEVLSVVERSGLFVTDVETLRLHYAETLKLWRERFHAHWDEAAKIYDERFCRMWDFYLAGSEAAFRAGAMMIFQLQLAKTQTALPLKRDYMFETEQQLREDSEFARESKPATIPLRSAH